MLKLNKSLELAAVILVMTAPASFAQEPTKPASLSETYNDWTVSCEQAREKQFCVMSQQQRKKDTNQLVLAAELRPTTDSRLAGSLVLPFGLRLLDGVLLHVDGNEPWKSTPFSTCLPVGCVVPLGLPSDRLSLLRDGKQLHIDAVANENGQKLSLTVSLNGFAQAQDRLVKLSAQSGKK